MNLIDISTDNGSIFGYVCGASAEQPYNYLAEFTPHARAIADWLSANCTTVAIGRNFSVDEESRGQGHGTELLTEFLNEASMANAILLVADTAESQLEGFGTLEDWYGRWDFTTICPTPSGPVMVYPEAIAKQLQAYLTST